MRSCTDPRNIIQFSDRNNVQHGPPLYAIGKTLALDCWNKHHWIFYTSGAHAEDISDWIHNQCIRLNLDFKTCYKVISDQKRQDGHVSVEALMFELKLYVLLGLPPEICVTLENETYTVGFTKSGIFFCRPGGRNTGAPNTSEGNSKMNAIMNLVMLHQQNPITNWNDPPIAIMVQGDDIFIIGLEDYLENISATKSIDLAAEMGFLVKFYDITRNLDDTDYCSRYFWPTYDHPLGYVLGPKIGKVLNKIGYSRTPTDCPYARNRGIALSLYKDLQHVPFLRKWVNHILLITEGYEAEELPYTHSIHSRSVSKPNAETWEFLYNRFGLTELDEDFFEIQLKQVDTLPYHIEIEWLNRVLDLDYQ